MADLKPIKSALVSVFHKDGLDDILKLLVDNGVTLYSTGGTHQFITQAGLPCTTVEEVTGYPSIFDGRVKTLHPKVFGGILSRREDEKHRAELSQYEIPEIDLVIVDLYPFEDTVKSGAEHSAIIEKIDIGGISLIRAAAKNYADVAIVASKAQYHYLKEALERNGGAATTLADRKHLAREAFAVSSNYDSAIFSYFDAEDHSAVRLSYDHKLPLRYGENPHQAGYFYGDFNNMFEQLHGKEISYNNLLDIDAAVRLISDFSETTFAILKHNNACGVASRPNLRDAYLAALAGDPVSAFGGVLITNQIIDAETAGEMNKLFIEVCIAPDFTAEALTILQEKKNRILLRQKQSLNITKQVRTALNGVLVQDSDTVVDHPEGFTQVTEKALTAQEAEDLVFANIIVKHSKSNAIVLAKNKQLIASGVGQTSRVDALKQAIEKAKGFGHDLKGAVMASDAFFPFADCVEIAGNEGIKAVIQPGGSVRDGDSIKYCDEHDMAMVTTGNRHFKH